MVRHSKMFSKRTANHIISLMGLVVALSSAYFLQPEEPAVRSGYYLVNKVVDGDTIKVTIDGEEHTVRLIGIDTPETVDPRKPVQCFGREASNRTKQLIEHKAVALEADPTQGDADKYQRLLRYVILEDGGMLNRQLLEEGYAQEYTSGSNPYAYQASFKQVEQEARQAGRGLWAESACAS